MANRRPQNGNNRRMDFRNDRKNFGRSGVSPWQGGGPGGGLPNLLPLSGGSTEATLALASNIINLLQPRQNPVPSLLDMPIRRDFGPNMGRYEYDRGFGPNRMVNQGNFRRTGNYNRAGERINTNRKPFRPNEKQQNKNIPKKEADSKPKPAKESEPEVKAEAAEQAEGSEIKEEDKKEPPKTRYDDINPQLLKCHICNKSMWDGRSFENHLSGRAHAIMMQKTAESYALTADTMRQEFKILAMKRSRMRRQQPQIREMKRTRKSGQQPARDFYCAMCDMYAADGALHRTTVGHRKLKKYLHPACTHCHKEMPTRIELDEHRLTADHLRQMHGKHDQVPKTKPEVMVVSTLSMEQTYVREDRQARRHDQSTADKEAAPKDTETDNQEEAATEIEGDANQTEKKINSVDKENVILDFKEEDELPEVTQDMIPAYSTERGVGQSFLRPMSCFECRLCHKVLDGEETASVHLRTWRHHQLFVRLLTKKAMHQEAEEAAAAASVATKRPASPEQSGNWKRRKTSLDPEEANDDEHNGIDGDLNIKEEKNGEASEQAGDAGGEALGDEPVGDELEDWDQMLDEVLQDEAANNEQSKEPELKQEPEPEKPEEIQPKEEQKDTPPEKAQTPNAPELQDKPVPIKATPALQNNPAPSPRGRGRGRGRARGRY